MIRKVLVVDDDRAVREALQQTLELADLEPVMAGSVTVAKDVVDQNFEGIVLSDIRMPGKDGFDFLEHLVALDRDLPVILLTGHADVPMAVRAMSTGAFDFLEKPCAPAELVKSVRRGLETRRLALENRALRREIADGDIVARLMPGLSPAMGALRAQVRTMASSRAPVLVTAEAGLSCRRVADALHRRSPRSDGPFATLRATSMEPIAVAARVADAEGGTLFLDTCNRLSSETQGVLCDALDEAADVRVVAGYLDGADAPTLMPDLRLRLDVLRLRIPPLRERPQDIVGLFKRYAAGVAEQGDLVVPDIGQEDAAWLTAQDWPGNDRALRNSAVRFVMGERDWESTEQMSLTERMGLFERALLVEALERSRGQAGKAAESLGLPRKTFYDKLARYSLKPEVYRS